MTDLHTHTTASDGRDEPDQLIDRAIAAGLRRIAITDHDTMSGVARAKAAAASAGITLIPGIEITAVERDRDMHVLGYFLDADHPRLDAFLRAQRADRVRRIREMADRLVASGFHIDVERLLASADRDESRAVGRPLLARALVAAGYATDTNDAFARLLGRGGPAYVPRIGAPTTDVIAIIHESGGVASLAHPGKTNRDDLIRPLADAGLDAIEVRHPDHTPEAEARYRAIALELGLLVTAGSDYHGSIEHGAALGHATMAEEEFEALAGAPRR
jgi:3',5'-nucleoside bisphosphate phosphatase